MSDQQLVINGVSAKTLTIVLTVLVALFGSGGVATLSGIENVPSSKDIDDSIKKSLVNVPTKETFDDKLDQVEKRFERIERLQEYQLLQDEHQTAVIMHIANKTRGPLPKKSPELIKAKRALMGH